MTGEFFIVFLPVFRFAQWQHSWRRSWLGSSGRLSMGYGIMGRGGLGYVGAELEAPKRVLSSDR